MSEENKREVDFGFDLRALDQMSEQFADRFASNSGLVDDNPIDTNDINKQEPIDNETSDVDNSTIIDDTTKDDEEDSTSQENLEDPSSQNTDDTSSLLTPYAKMLVEEGLLPDLNLEDYDGTSEAIVEAERTKILNEINQGIEEYKNTLDPRLKWLQDNMEAGVPIEELLRVDRSKTTYDTITEDSLVESGDLQKDIVKQYFKETTRFSDDKINKEIERLEQLGELEEESKGYLSDLKDITAQKEVQLKQQAEQQEEARKNEQIKILEDFQNTLKGTTEILPGIKLNDTVKDNIYKSLTTVVDIDEYGQPLNNIAKARQEDPIGFEIKLAYLWDITKGFSDWNTIVASGKKSAMKDFEKAASKMNLENNTIPKRPKFSSADTNSYLEAMKKMQF
jgi:hypothetical protein